jgi:motility quorum-sensing regulator/GCU-specific mRNA interferase toxin
LIPVEKIKPHYQLSAVQDEVARRGAAAFTMTALRNGLAMGLTVAQMIDVVRSLTRGDFYKSMTTHADHRVWQDVYHAAAPAGKVAYVKVTGQGEGMPPVIQFKEL